VKIKILIITILLFLTSTYILADGWKQDKFYISLWWQPPMVNESVSMLARDNYSVTPIYSSTIQGYVDTLNLLEKHKVKGIIISRDLINPKTIDDSDKLAQLNKLIDAVKNHPALEGYYIDDEPQASEFSGLSKIINYIKSKDSKSLCLINLFPTYASKEQLGVFLDKPINYDPGVPPTTDGLNFKDDTVKNYAEYLNQYFNIIKPDFLGYDHYHFFKDGVDGQQYFLNLAITGKYSREKNVPFFNSVQAGTTDAPWRQPNQDELRFLGYSTIAYGGKGILWFLMWGPTMYGGMYQVPKEDMLNNLYWSAPEYGGGYKLSDNSTLFNEKYRQPSANEIANVNKELAILGPELLKLNYITVKHTKPLPLGTNEFDNKDKAIIDNGEFFIGFFTDENKNDAFIVVNRNYKTASSANIKLKYGNKPLYEFTIKDQKWVKVLDTANKPFDVSLRAGDGRIFKYIK